MSNPLNIIATNFEDKNTREEFEGFRIFDDYGGTYHIPYLEGEDMPDLTDNIVLLKFALEWASQNEQAYAMFASMIEMERGLHINHQYYDYAEIEEYLKDTVFDV